MSDAVIGPCRLGWEAWSVINKILLAVDGSEGSSAAEALALDVGRRLSAEVVVLHVCGWVFGPSGPFDEGPRRSYELADRVARRLADHGLRARPRVRSTTFARTAREIVEVARNEDVDLIVMGCHRGAGRRRSLHGGAIDRVLQLATIPVLVTGPLSNFVAPRRAVGVAIGLRRVHPAATTPLDERPDLFVERARRRPVVDRQARCAPRDRARPAGGPGPARPDRRVGRGRPERPRRLERAIHRRP
jgi:nucleotide-binding universal stress UspA family protein